MQPAPAEKTMQSAPAPAPAPAPASTAPAAKAEPAPGAAEAKPAPAVSEADFMQMAKKGNCLACHSVDKKVVGPAFKDVAAKYRGDAGAEARLADKIAKGGSGVWGAMMMPPNPQVSEADRRTLAKYILSLK
jgi:cytochrome c